MNFRLSRKNKPATAAQQNKRISPRGSGLRHASVHDLAELGPSSIVIDVRDRTEFQEAHVAWALNIPLSELPRRIAEIPTDRPVHLICADGGRSLSAADLLAQAGVTPIPVVGGTAAWLKAGYPDSFTTSIPTGAAIAA